MSALGETMVPGETGTVTKLEHMPDQIPDNPATLSANTSIETLQNILYQNWVWRNTFTIDSSMQPGHVFGFIKIHPQNCNDYITHISRMFLTWNGSFKIRSRFMATFQFGGSFRLGFLPPKFKESEIQNLPIQTLTAYPNVDLDPKNTMWMEFQASDERNVLFHWMADLADEAPETFAGWFVFYVAAPLVLSGTSTSVSMLVEAAGSFDFAQLSPINQLGPSGNGWLNDSATQHITGQPGCDSFLTGAAASIQIEPITTKSLPGGWLFSKAVGGADPWNVTPGAVCDPRRIAYKEAARTNSILITNPTYAVVTITGSGDTANCAVQFSHPATGLICADGTRSMLAVVSQTTSPGSGTISGSTIQPSDHYQWIGNDPTPKFNTLPTASAVSGTNMAIVSAGPFVNGVNVANVVIRDDNSTLPNTLPDESIVLFVDSVSATINMQTKAMAASLAKAPIPDPNNSQIYQLFSSSQPQPLLNIRIHPSGMMTTNATDVRVNIGEPDITLYLRYLQDLPMNSPLPNTLSSQRFVRNIVHSQKRNHNAVQRRIHVWNAVL